MKTLKRLVIFLAIIVALLAAAILSGALDEAQDKGTPYRSETITRGTIGHFITATGTISPEEVVTVGTQVSGQITKLYVKLNDTVTKGQLLAEIDSSIPETQLKQSKAALETAQLAYTLAQRDHERTKALVAKEYVAKIDLERAWQSLVSAKNSLEGAKIQVERDQVNLGYTKVTSPIDGIIIAQEATSGQTVASSFSTPNLFRIARDLTVMKIDMNVPESDISKIQQGMPVKFSVDAFPDREFSGRVDLIDLNPNNQSGVVTYNVVVKLENTDRALFPGMTANISITMSEVKDILRVPTAALRFSPQHASTSPLSRLTSGRMFGKRGSNPPTKENSEGTYIHLWADNQVKKVRVNIGASDDLYFEVHSDEIKEGDVVLTGLLPQED